MVTKMERDRARFKQIVRGKIKAGLGKYISHGEMIGRQGRDLVSIPIPQIDLPDFRYGEDQTGGVGQGEGEAGTPLGPGQPGEGTGAGSGPGQHITEVEVSLEELAQILGEELELPWIESKGQKDITSPKHKYTGISRSGPESLRHFKRTYRQALKRQILAGIYDPRQPRVVPIRQDQQYRSFKNVPEPKSAAAIFYLMDVSASMGDQQKQNVRSAAFWIDTWLKANYEGVECRYIIHDAVAREVEEEVFYRTRESGGTAISSAYELCQHTIDAEYPPEDWNLYCFHFSDGDNLSQDNERCRQLLSERLLGQLNLFCYGQVRSPYGSGAFLKQVRRLEEDHDNIAAAEIPNRDGILEAIRTFLAKGR